MENNMTAVEYLAMKLKDFPHIKYSQRFKELVGEAKQIEKKQIVEAARWEPFLGEMSKEVGEQYYDEKYGNSREVAQ